MEKNDDSWWWAKVAIFFGAVLLLYRLGVFQLVSRHPYLIWMTLGELSAVGVATGIAWEYNRRITAENLRLSSGTNGNGSIHLGVDKDTGQNVYMEREARTRHTIIRGPTGYGKTSRGIARWGFHDIENGCGHLIIDGKGDNELLGQFYAMAKRHGREKDFLVFSLGNPSISSTFNPFYGGDGVSITERVFSSLTFTDEYYRGLQYSAFKTVVDLLLETNTPVLPGVVRELLRDRRILNAWLQKKPSSNINRDMLLLLETPKEKYAENHSGIVSQLGGFVQGAQGALFNVQKPDIILQDCLSQGKIVFFQVPTMRFPFLGAATGKLVLQCLQSAIATIQNGDAQAPKNLFSVYLDDFNDFLYPEFVLLLNKSRSANIGVVFSHQSQGDIDKLGPEVAKTFADSTCNKIFMATKDADTASSNADYFGTKLSEATTEKRTSGIFGKTLTGDESVRKVQEYARHPDLFKRELQVGEAVVGISGLNPDGFRIQLIAAEKIAPDNSFPKRKHPDVDYYAAATNGVVVAPEATETTQTVTKDSTQLTKPDGSQEHVKVHRKETEILEGK